MKICISDADDSAIIEQTLRQTPFDFESLPLLIEGESKIIRRWTRELVVIRHKPTVYSYTHNRYNVAPGTDAARARFSAAAYRYLSDGERPIRHAFVGLLEQDGELFTLQRRVETANLEVRVKRYHIGSPVHRYRFTEHHETTLNSGPLQRWTRFEQPLVCFDWRHPLRDEAGERLADEPLPDDYAAVWMENILDAKTLARETFLQLETLFRDAGFQLIDICFFIDRTGRVLYGEISPDCMRIRPLDSDLETSPSYDKDLWRQGAAGETLLQRYEMLLKKVFPNSSSEPANR